MSVLIKGFNLPAEPMILILHPDGNISTEDYDIGANAKAIQLPAQHGRLIDADALLASNLGGEPFKSVIRRVLLQSPTIIEAEEVNE